MSSEIHRALFFTSKPPVFQPPLEIHSYSEICVRQASVKPPVACIAKMKFEFEVRNVAISSSSPESLRISSPLSQPDCSESSVFCGCLKRLCGLTNLSVLTRTVPQGKGCSLPANRHHCMPEWLCWQRLSQTVVQYQQEAVDGGCIFAGSSGAVSLIQLSNAIKPATSYPHQCCKTSTRKLLPKDAVLFSAFRVSTP